MKQYIKGYNIEFHRASLINKSHIVLSNELPYGKGRLEAVIRVVNGQITAYITDGYKYLTIEKSGYKSLKTALNIMHGKMQEITHKLYSRLD